MWNQRSLLLATGDPLLEGELAGLEGVTLVTSACETGHECLEAVATHAPQVVLLSAALAPWPGALATLVREIGNRAPQAEVAVLAMPDQLGSVEIQSVQQAGGKLLPMSGAPKEAVAALLRGRPETFAPAPPAPTLAPPAPTLAPPPLPVAQIYASVMRQKVVAVWGGKGGTGRSTLVTALGDIISRIPGVRVCAVDLNPASTSLAALLRKETERNSWWTLANCLLSGPLTAQAVRESLVAVHGQWSLLTSPAGSDQWSGWLTAPILCELLDILRAEFDYILLDLPAGRTPVGDAALAQAQEILLVVSAFFPDVVDTTRMLEQVLVDGILTRERCRLILSQWVDSGELPASDVSACLGLTVSGILPLAPLAAIAAARAGRPVTQLGLAEAKGLAEAAMAVAGLVAEAAVQRPQRRNWFGNSHKGGTK